MKVRSTTLSSNVKVMDVASVYQRIRVPRIKEQTDPGADLSELSFIRRETKGMCWVVATYGYTRVPTRQCTDLAEEFIPRHLLAVLGLH